MAARIGCAAGAGRGFATGATARIGCTAGEGRGLATGADGAAAPTPAGAGGMLARRPGPTEYHSLPREGSAARPILLSPSPSPPRAEKRASAGGKTIRSSWLVANHPQSVEKLEIRKKGMSASGEEHVNHVRLVLRQVRLPFYYSGSAHPPPPPTRDEVVPTMNLMTPIERTRQSIMDSSTVQSDKGKRPLGLLHANDLQTPSNSNKRKCQIHLSDGRSTIRSSWQESSTMQSDKGKRPLGLVHANERKIPSNSSNRKSPRHLSDGGNNIRSSCQSNAKFPTGLTQATRGPIFESHSKEMFTHGLEYPAVGFIDALPTSQELPATNAPPIFQKVANQPQIVEKLDIKRNGIPSSGGGHVNHVRPIF